MATCSSESGGGLTTLPEHNGKFGASDKKLGLMVSCGPSIGAEIRAEIEKVFPAQAALVERLTAEWRSNAKRVKNQWGGYSYKNGWITGLDGRPIFIESEHTVLVYTLQSDETICMAAAYCLLYKRLLAKGLEWGKDWAYVCWMHDEFQIEARDGVVDMVAREAEKAIGDAGRFFGIKHCPQVGEADIGRNWYETH